MRKKTEPEYIPLNSQVPVRLSGQEESPNGGEEDRLWTIDEAAEYLHLNKYSLYHLVSQKRIPVVKLSARCIRFSREALLGWIEGMTHAADSGDVHQKRKQRS